MVLLISAFLLILGLAFLSFMGNDYYFAGALQARTSAFYLARAGMTYYAASGLPPVDTAAGDRRIYVPPGDLLHYCVITVDNATNTIVFRGTVAGEDGRSRAVRTLVAPSGSLSDWYEGN